MISSWTYWHGEAVELPFVIGSAIFAGLLLLACMFPIRVSERSEISAADIVMIAAVVMVGPLWATVAMLPCVVLVGKTDWLRTTYEAARRTTEICLAAVVFSATSDPLLSGPPESMASAVYATLALGVTLLIVNFTIDAGLLKVKYRQGFGETWKELAEPYLLSDLLSVLAVGLGVLTLLVYGPPAALVVVAGSVASQVLVHRSREKFKESQKLRVRVASLEEALATSNTTFGAMMIQELGRKDGYTHRHAAATAVYAADLAREMKLGDTHAEQLRMAGLLHNIGLFGLPEELLRATGKLNSVAQNQLAEHPARGEEALAAIPEFEEMASWVRWHHERPDGRGYPDKLRRAWIPLEAKILAVAQAYAAMVLDQPHRPGMGFAEAREKLSAGIDTEFDGVVVRALMRILDTESEGYRMADDYRFVFPTPKDRERTRPAVPEPGFGIEEGRARDLPG